MTETRLLLAVPITPRERWALKRIFASSNILHINEAPGRSAMRVAWVCISPKKILSLTIWNSRIWIETLFSPSDNCYINLMMFKLKGLPRKKKSTINRKNQDTMTRSLWTPIPQKLTSSGIQYFLLNYPRYFLFHPLNSWLVVTQQMKGTVFCAASVLSWFLTLSTCFFEH